MKEMLFIFVEPHGEFVETVVVETLCDSLIKPALISIYTKSLSLYLKKPAGWRAGNGIAKRIRCAKQNAASRKRLQTQNERAVALIYTDARLSLPEMWCG